MKTKKINELFTDKIIDCVIPPEAPDTDYIDVMAEGEEKDRANWSEEISRFVEQPRTPAHVNLCYALYQTGGVLVAKSLYEKVNKYPILIWDLLFMMPFGTMKIDDDLSSINIKWAANQQSVVFWEE